MAGLGISPEVFEPQTAEAGDRHVAAGCIAVGEAEARNGGRRPEGMGAVRADGIKGAGTITDPFDHEMNDAPKGDCGFGYFGRLWQNQLWNLMKTIHVALLVWPVLATTLPTLARDSGNLVLPVITGNTLTSQPFGYDISSPAQSTRYQQVYAASGFASVAPIGGTISRLAFEEAGTEFAATYPSLRIDFSVTDALPDSLSPVYADNLGQIVTTVFGPERYTLGTDNWSLDAVGIILDTPFFYDPRQGNLLIDVWISERPIRGTYEALQGESAFGDAVSRVYGGTVDSPSGTVDNIGLVTWFTIEPIPEPSPLRLVLVLGALALGSAFIRNRHSSES